MTVVGRQFEQHRAEVEKRRGHWLAQKQASEVALARVQERIVGLQADQVVQRWEAQAIADISARAGQVSKLVESGRFEHATRDADKLLGEVERVLKAAEERQCCQEQQDYIAQSTVAALQECGFTVDGMSQSPQGDGGIVIQVHKWDGRGFAVSVPKDGPLGWSPYGFSMEIEEGSNGQPATVCDEAVAEIEAVQDRLNKDYGVETCALTWAGQDPNRAVKATKSRGRPASYRSQRAREARQP
jgi:hypothetical protein